jgi:hypothetical protein
MFAGKMPEGGLAFIVTGIWAGALPVIMKPDNEIGVSASFGILDANLYFSSWAAAITAVYILGNYAQTVMKLRALDFSKTSSQMIKWYLFTFASVVVLSSSSRLFKATDCTEGNSYCRRTQYGIFLGALGAAFGLIMCLMSFVGKLPRWGEAGMAFLSLAAYACGVAAITFGGEKGPGTEIGNLYFSTWIGFILSVFLTVTCWAEVRDKGEEGEAESAPADADVEDKVDVPEEAPAATHVEVKTGDEEDTA